MQDLTTNATVMDTPTGSADPAGAIDRAASEAARGGSDELTYAADHTSMSAVRDSDERSSTAATAATTAASTTTATSATTSALKADRVSDQWYQDMLPFWILCAMRTITYCLSSIAYGYLCSLVASSISCFHASKTVQEAELYDPQRITIGVCAWS